MVSEVGGMEEMLCISFAVRVLRTRLPATFDQKNSRKRAIFDLFSAVFILFAQKWRFGGDHMFALISNLQTVVSSQFFLCFRKSLIFDYSDADIEV